MELSFDHKACIETPRLVLRAFCPADVGDMLKNWVADPQVQRGYGEPVYTTPEQAAGLLDAWKGQYRWALIDKGRGENIGHISFCRLYDGGVAEVEYCVGRAFWGKGLAAEGLRAFVRHTFCHTAIHKLEAFHRAENAASGRVLQKAGFLPTGNVTRFSHLSGPPPGDLCYAICKAVAAPV